MILICYHQKCNDGLYSAYLINKLYPGTTLGCNPNVLPPMEILECYETVIFVDLYMDNKKIESVADSPDITKIIYIDHHPRNQDNDLSLIKSPKLEYIYNTTICASRIIYHLLPESKRGSDKLIEYIDNYDNGRFSDLNPADESAFDYWYEMCSGEKNFITAFPALEQAFNLRNKYYSYLVREGQHFQAKKIEAFNKILDEKVMVKKINITKSKEVENSNVDTEMVEITTEYTIKIIKFDGFRGALAKYYCSTKNWDDGKTDIIFVYGLEEKPWWDTTPQEYTASVRASPASGIDLNDLLNQHGGGGHELAGGIKFPKEKFNEILQI